jgi:ribulose-phosphate 3-epimerase
MSSIIKISPSILSADFSKLGEEIINLEKAGADYIHIDVMDGHFVPNITIGPEVIKRLRPITKLVFDVHLMIAPVDNFIKDFAEAGADGVSLKPESPISLIESYLEQLDLILIMSVNPGFGGQKFMPEVLDKMKKLKEIVDHKKLEIDIEIDGGINFENSQKVKNCGANILVSGSTVFKENKGDLKKNIQILRSN